VLPESWRHGINKTTLYNWKAKFADMQTSDVRRLRHLEDENRRLKQLLADAQLDIAGLKNAVSKKVLTVPDKRIASDAACAAASDCAKMLETLPRRRPLESSPLAS